MKQVITKYILTSTLLIFIGLSVSADYVPAYNFNESQTSILPSEQSMIDNGNMFSESDMFGSRPQRGFGDDGGDDGFDPGGGSDCPHCFVDAPVGNGTYMLLLLAAAYGVFIFRRKKAYIA